MYILSHLACSFFMFIWLLLLHFPRVSLAPLAWQLSTAREVSLGELFEVTEGNNRWTQVADDDSDSLWCSILTDSIKSV